MQLHLEHGIHFGRERQYSSLYQWYLQERDSDGKDLSGRLVPWGWTLHFVATELSYYFNVSRDRSLFGGDQDKPVVASERLNGVLRSCERRFGSSTEWGVRMSMFGTDRLLKDIHLGITATADEAAAERCYLNGFVSNTSELDFADVTDSDQLFVDLVLKPSTFQRLKQMVCSERIDRAELGIGEVAGFYSEWSPSISTHSIKVLAAGDDQKVVGHDDESVTIPRLGEAGSFSLIFTERVVPVAGGNPAETDAEDSDDERPDSLGSEGRTAQALTGLAQQLAQQQQAIQSLRTPLWLAVLLLLLLVFLG